MKVFNAVVLASAVALGIGLVYLGAMQGSVWLIGAGIVGVPVLLIVGAMMHYAQVGRRAQGLEEIQTRSRTSVVDRWSAQFERTFAAMKKAALPEADVGRYTAALRQRLQPHFVLEVSDGKVVLKEGEGAPSSGWLHKTDVALEALAVEHGARAAAVLDERLQSLAASLAQPAPPAIAPGAVGRVCDAYLDAVQRIGGPLATRIDQVERAVSTVEEQGIDVEDAWSNLRSARRLWEQGETDLALKALADAESLVHLHMTPEFEQRRGELVSSVAAVLGLDLQGIAPPVLLDDLGRIHRETQALDVKTGGLTAVERNEKRFADALSQVAAETITKAERAKEALAAYPALSDKQSLDDLVRLLKEAPAVGHPYQEAFPAWIDAMRQATLRLQQYLQDSALIRHLPRLEQIIAKKLAENRRVVAADLPVRERADVILGLYARLHPDAVKMKDGAIVPKEA